VFPVPAILQHAPPLIGYYRMLLGLSKKEFGDSDKLGYGPWLKAEERATIPTRLLPQLPRLCAAFIEPLVKLVYAMDTFDDRDLSDLALLTLGPTLQRARNNIIGSRAAKDVFDALRTLVADWTTFDSERLIRFKAPNEQTFVLIQGADPDVRLDATAASGDPVPVIAMEVKGGRDTRNIHNRAGEAEKSHLKARIAGYEHRWTIMMMRGLDRNRLRSETPSTTALFDATEVMDQLGADWEALKREFCAMIGDPYAAPP